MGISENRLSVNMLAELFKLDFESKDEGSSGRTNKPPAKRGSGGSNGGSSIIPTKKPQPTPAQVAIGDLGDAACAVDNIPKQQKILRDAKNADRSSNKIKTNCKVASDITDNVLKNMAPVFSSSGIINSINEGKLGDIINTTVKAYLTGDLKALGNTEQLINDIKASFINTVKVLGGTINQKLHLNDLLNKCNSKTTLNNKNAPIVEEIVLATILDSISCLGMAYMAEFFGKTIGLSEESKLLILRALRKSFNKDNDPEVYSKLLLVKAIKDAGLLVSTDGVNLKGPIDKVIVNLSNSKHHTDSNMTTFVDIVDALDTFDGSWYKDENGVENYYRLKNNKKMEKLSNNYINNNHPHELASDFTGEVVTVIDRPRAMSIVSRLN